MSDAINWRWGEFAIIVPEGKLLVRGLMGGPFGIKADTRPPRFSLTHLATGYRIPHTIVFDEENLLDGDELFQTIDEVVRFAEKILPLNDWATQTPDNAKERGSAPGFRQALRKAAIDAWLESRAWIEKQNSLKGDA